VRKEAVAELEWKNNAREIDEAIREAAAARILFKQNTRWMIRELWFGRLWCGAWDRSWRWRFRTRAGCRCQLALGALQLR
jgi:hypothetical protein